MSLNIWTGRAGGLETALQELQQGNVDVGLLQEKKLTQRIHKNHGVGYNVWETEAESLHREGVAVVWRAAKLWQVENTARFVPNVVILLLMSGAIKWYVVGAYVPPNDRPSVNCMEQAL